MTMEAQQSVPLFYTPQEVARLFRVDPKTVSRWAARSERRGDGRLPCIRTLGGHRRFRVDVIHALLDEEGVKSPGSLHG